MGRSKGCRAEFGEMIDGESTGSIVDLKNRVLQGTA
jgi:hypothetical protein